MKGVLKLLASVGLCLMAGVIGSLFTDTTGWYESLVKPAFNPPGWIFGPVWTILYVLMGVALYLVWNKGALYAAEPFMIQLVFNILWSVLFFGLKSPSWALIDIIFLWVLIIITMMKFAEIEKKAMYLLIPYLIWVSFAAALNLSIVMLN